MILTDLLTPVSTTVEKKRFGPVNDGGYVILNKSFGEVAVFGYGVGHDATFEGQIAESLGCKAYVFDHTLGDKIPELYPNTTFVPEGITGSSENSNLKMFSTHLNKLVGPEGDVLLKIDVEGAEWDVLANDVFDRVTQLVIELHDLEDDTQRKIELITKIRKNFDLVHIHGVNCHNQPIFFVDRLVRIPRYIECVFIRKGLVDVVPCNENYPTPLDAKSRLDAPDVLQDFWNLKTEPINFLVGPNHANILRNMMCSYDTINEEKVHDKYNFLIKDDDAFPHAIVYKLSLLTRENMDAFGLMVFKRAFFNIEYRLFKEPSKTGGYSTDPNLSIWSI